jgi:AraC-like DNA-binding protein
MGWVLPESVERFFAGGFVRYQEFPPNKSLAPWVKCFWLLEDSPVPDGPMDAVVPDGCPEIIVHYGDRFSEDAAGRRVVQSDVIAAGQMTRPLMLRPTGRVGMVAARFRADGLFPILGVPMHELVDQRVPLEAICGDVSTLQARIAEAGSDRERVRQLATFLERKLLERKLAERCALDAVVEHNVHAILASGGQISPDQLAQRAGLTARQLERRFQVSVGVSPKFLCRIVRFRAIFDRLQSRAPWPNIALDCGFFDQSHLIRDFKQFAGQSPTAFLAAQSEFGRCFTKS